MSSFESPAASTPHEQELAEAMAIINSNPKLVDHPRVRAMVKTGFVTEEGRELSPLAFVAAMNAQLEKGGLTQLTPAELSDLLDKAEKAAVEHSGRPDIAHAKESRPN